MIDPQGVQRKVEAFIEAADAYRVRSLPIGPSYALYEVAMIEARDALRAILPDLSALISRPASAEMPVTKEIPANPPNMIDAAEMLWVVLANVSGGDWTKQSQEWQDAAARWRDYYFQAVEGLPSVALKGLKA